MKLFTCLSRLFLGFFLISFVLTAIQPSYTTEPTKNQLKEYYNKDSIKKKLGGKQYYELTPEEKKTVKDSYMESMTSVVPTAATPNAETSATTTTQTSSTATTPTKEGKEPNKGKRRSTWDLDGHDNAPKKQPPLKNLEEVLIEQNLEDIESPIDEKVVFDFLEKKQHKHSPNALKIVSLVAQSCIDGEALNHFHAAHEARAPDRKSYFNNNDEIDVLCQQTASNPDSYKIQHFDGGHISLSLYKDFSSHIGMNVNKVGKPEETKTVRVAITLENIKKLHGKRKDSWISKRFKHSGGKTGGITCHPVSHLKG